METLLEIKLGNKNGIPENISYLCSQNIKLIKNKK